MQSKLTDLASAVGQIRDGSRIAIGGNTIHRGPGAAVHELVRQGKTGLEVIKTAGAYDIDLLSAAGCAASVSAGYVGYESVFGLAPAYRRAVESGVVVASEHACYTVIAGLRAAIQGVPFMPVAGLIGSDLLAARDFRTIADPYTGETVVAIPALKPDVAIIHVHEVDELGNALIVGSKFEDVLMAQAADYVILTAERIADDGVFASDPVRASISSLYVDAVVETPRGAWPLGCAGLYKPDLVFLAEFVNAGADADRLSAFIADRILALVAA